MKKLRIIIASIILLSMFLSATAYALDPSLDVIFNGIDVSQFQGNIDFEKVKEDGIEIVYIRAGAGNDFKDPKFEVNYSKAKNVGLKIGFYYSMTAASESEAISQAQFFSGLVSGKEADARLALDYSLPRYATTAQINSWTLTFINKVEELTEKECMLYTDAFGAKTVYSQEVADRVPLWVAQYGVIEPEDNGKWSSWVGFQYSDTGRINGISGDVDLDKFTEDVLLSDSSKIPGEKPDVHRETKLIQITVEKGDTLSRIASKYDTTVSELVKLNKINNPDLIFIGQKLYVRVDINYPQKCYDTYTVVRGDTLTKIANRFSTTVQQLAGINKIRNIDLIFIGETLVIGQCR